MIFVLTLQFVITCDISLINSQRLINNEWHQIQSYPETVLVLNPIWGVIIECIE